MTRSLDAETDREGEAATPAAADFDLVVADASWSWTERLFAPLSALGQRLLLIKACDWRTAHNQKRPARDWLCPQRQVEDGLWERTFVLPPGWMKTYPRLGMLPIAWAVRDWRKGLDAPRPLVLAISYPHYLHLRDLVQPDALIYYNMDDYGFYWAGRREIVRTLEQQSVREADLSAFCARIRADELRVEVPEADDRIIHLPHGAPASAISPGPRHRPGPAPADLAALARPYLGFVGSLEDRIDWGLVEHLAREFPEGSIVLIGREPVAAPQLDWYRDYQRAVARPNVHLLGWKSQDEIGAYNAAFDACLIPYRTDHPFNRVACPTKVMDYMATSRPIVSTDLPECRLYSHLFDVTATCEAFATAVRRIVDRGSDDGRAAQRWEAARASTWEHRSETLLRQFRGRIESRTARLSTAE